MQLLGVRIDNVTMAETLDKIQGFLSDGKQHYIVTVNPEFIVRAQKDEEFRKILNEADLAIPDGIGVVWAARFLGERLKERVAGVDLISRFKKRSVIARSEQSEQRGNPVDIGNRTGSPRPAARAAGLAMTPLRVFLLGGKNGVAERIAADWPEVVGFSEETEGMELFARIREYQSNILLVALGAPKQEKWIAANLSKIPSVKLAIGVGGGGFFF